MLNIREDLIEKINAYRQGDLRQDEIALWFFNCAASSQFEDLSESDPTSRDIVLDLLRTYEKTALMPEPRVLDDYLECLSGGKPYKPVAAPPARQRDIATLIKEVVCRTVFVILRVYLSLFAICSLCLNTVILQIPNFFDKPHMMLEFISNVKYYIPEKVFPGLFHAVTDPQFFLFLQAVRPQHTIMQIPILHLAFAFLALLPSRFMMKSVIFIISLPLLSLGALYYWHITWDISFKVAYIFSISRLQACINTAVFIAIPASLVLARLIFINYELHVDQEK